ncbi:MAG: DUF2267 domain-containing protein [Prochloraceae cyanobacterium]|nr:DUF2267 domain-containing protein [Prochloraceae cyanobacterium]
MKYDEFIKHVQSFAQLDSSESAQKGIRATLSTLAERIDPALANKLADQLPEEISTYLRVPQENRSSSFSLEEFYSRVIEKEEIAPAQAVMHVRSVFAVLNCAVNPTDFREVQAHLDQDYEELFPMSSNPYKLVSGTQQ